VKWAKREREREMEMERETEREERMKRLKGKKLAAAYDLSIASSHLVFQSLPVPNSRPLLTPKKSLSW
jgi:hypothetical protein